MSRIARSVLAVFVLSFFLVATAYADDDRDAARAAALNWLSHVDSGDYDNAWSAAAEFFRSNVTEGQWRTAANNVRSPLGDLVSRVFDSARHSARLPGFPQGDYYVVLFHSRFEDRGTASETVTVMNDNGEWRAVGYYIQ